MVIVALYFYSVQLCALLLQAPSDWNTVIVQSIPRNILRILPSTLDSLLWSGPDATINESDPMHNLDQTWMFYKPCQI